MNKFIDRYGRKFFVQCFTMGAITTIAMLRLFVPIIGIQLQPLGVLESCFSALVGLAIGFYGGNTVSKNYQNKNKDIK